jgi:hypothetical protein
VIDRKVDDHIACHVDEKKVWAEWVQDKIVKPVLSALVGALVVYVIFKLTGITP